MYAPDKSEKAKVFAWTAELKPIRDDSGRTIELSGDDDKTTVTILHTNDMHGSLVGSSSVIGMDTLAAFKKMENAILTDSGDAGCGSRFALSGRGRNRYHERGGLRRYGGGKS